MTIREGSIGTIAVLALMVSGVAWSLLPTDPVPATFAASGVFDRGALDLRIDGSDDVAGFLRGENLIPGGPGVEGTLALSSAGSAALRFLDLDVGVSYTAEEGDWPEAVAAWPDMGHFLEVRALRYGDLDLLRDPVRGTLAVIDAHPTRGNGDGTLSLAELTAGLNDLPPPGRAASATPVTLDVALAAGTPNTVMGDRVRVTFTFLLAQSGTDDLTLPAEGPVVTLDVAPLEATVAAGSTVQVFAVPRNAEGRVVAGVTPTFELLDPSIGTFSPTGEFLGKRTGTTEVIVRAGGIEVRIRITVIPGPLAEIRVIPSHVTVPGGETLQFRAEGFDAFGNARDKGADAFTWVSEDPAVGTVSGEGRFTAGPRDAVVRLSASAGDVFRQFVVTIVGGRAPSGEVTVLVATPALTMASNTTALAEVVGLAEVEGGARLSIRGGALEAGGAAMSSRGDVSTADVVIGSASRNLALVLEVQPGSMVTAPPEVHTPTLEERLASMPATPREPGLFLSVRATEDGIPVRSERLNEILDRVEVNFTVDRDYLRANRLDPRAPRLVEFSEGRLVRDDLVGELLSTKGGLSTYRVVLEEFSTFAIVWSEMPRVRGGGGGAPIAPAEPTTADPVPGGAPAPDPREVTVVPVVRDGPPGREADAVFSAPRDSTVLIPLDAADPALGLVRLRLSDPVSEARVHVGMVPREELLLLHDVGSEEPLFLIDLGFDGPEDAVAFREISFVLTPRELGSTPPSEVRLLVRVDGAWVGLPFTVSPEGAGTRFTAKLPALAPILVVIEGKERLLPTPLVRGDGPPHIVPILPAPGGWSSDARPLLFAGFPDLDVDGVSVVVRVDGAPMGGAVASPTGVLVLPLADLGPGRHTVEVEVSGLNGQRNRTAWSFGVDAEPPSLARPRAGEPPLGVAGATELRLGVSDAVSGVDPSGAEVTLDGAPVQAAYRDGFLVMTLRGPLAEGDHHLRISVRDQAGNVAEETLAFQAASSTNVGWPLLLGILGLATAVLFFIVWRRRRDDDEEEEEPPGGPGEGSNAETRGRSP